MSNIQALVRKTAGAGTMNNYGDRFLVGNHVVALDHLQAKELWSDDLNCKIEAVTADFIVLSSDSMKPGSKVSEKYDVGKPGNSGENASKRLNGLARAVVQSLGHTQKPEDIDGKLFEKLVGDTLIKMLELDPANGFSRTSGRKFIGRGIALKVFSKINIARKGKHQGKEFVNNDFSPQSQTTDQIKAKRAMIEAPPAPSAEPQKTVAATKPSTIAAKPSAPVANPVNDEPADDVLDADDMSSEDMLAGLE